MSSESPVVEYPELRGFNGWPELFEIQTLDGSLNAQCRQYRQHEASTLGINRKGSQAACPRIPGHNAGYW